MSKPFDGGPAFPRPPAVSNNPGGQTGMSLRDYFAGQYLAGRIARGYSGLSSEGIVTQAYLIADHMIRQREK